MLSWSRNVSLTLLCVATIGCGPIYEMSDDFIYQPERVRALDGDEGAPGERWTLPVEGGGEVVAWFFPPSAEVATPSPAVIFAHGNRERIEPWAAVLEPYRELGMALLLIEYRGYGESAGTPSEEAIVSDAAAFYDRLVARPDIDGTRIVLHGRSLGGGVVAALSRERVARVLILESTFTNMPDLAARWFAPAAAMRDRYDTLAVLRTSSTPVLILHGVRDQLVPFEHAVELDRVAFDSRLVAFDADHSDIVRGPAYWRAIQDFLLESEVLDPTVSAR
ncbi:MAG: alpha/beta hydrolase [Sandaracinaceae bacterium]